MTSNQPSWMPSDQQLRNAWVGCGEVRQPPGRDWFDFRDGEAIRILIRSAVSKREAELEARHTREIERAKLIGQLLEARAFPCSAAVDGHPASVCRRCARVEIIEAALVALDAKADAAPGGGT